MPGDYVIHAKDGTYAFEYDMARRKAPAMPESVDLTLDEIMAISAQAKGSFGKADEPTFYRYIAMRLAGESHNMAEMLALREFPATRTDVEFNRGRCNGNQFETTPGLGDHYRRVAERAGVSTTGKFYSAGLASFPGDPTAWVSDKSDVLRVAREKGLRVSGAVEYDPPERSPLPDIEIDPEIVKGRVAEVMAADPGARREDVWEREYARLTGKDDDGQLRVSDPVTDEF